MPRPKTKRRPFSTISLPTSLTDEIEKIVEELKFWPTKTDFVREAAMEKLKKCRKELHPWQKQTEESEASKS